MTDVPAPPPGAVEDGDWRATLQRFGGYLTAIVMPNIGAFIAFGLITALFIETGWTPNEDLAQLVGPLINVLLPVLLGYTGGRLVHGQRGAVAGAVATMGLIVAAGVFTEEGGSSMLLGAMIIGPLSGYLMKLFDNAVEGRVRSGFEMLVNNFSLGILGALMAVFGFYLLEPLVESLTNALGSGVNWLVDANLLPVASVIIEPAKVLFLNNAINHGVLSPLGLAQAEETGRSILFMLESNPGPGLGLLLAFWLAGPKAVRPTVPGAMIIHFFGGIHEIYFPYVLMRPQLLIAAIAGGATGVATFLITGAGLIAPPSPGSIIAYMAVTPRGGYLGVLLGILLSAAVSFVVGWGILRLSPQEESTEEELEEAREQSAANKAPSRAPAPTRPAEA
jgi:mannitol PTS system EIICBA or EIICB component